MALVLGAVALGTEALAATAVRSRPTVVVTGPTGSVSTTTVTATWTYSSLIARPQAGYRVVLVSGGNVLFDSGIAAGDDASLALSYVLSPFTSYELWVGVNDGLDGAEDPYGVNGSWGSTTFSTGTLAITHDANSAVGRIYEIGINSVGYMLDDTAERTIKRQTAHLQADRFATGETPFSEAIDRYTQVSTRTGRAARASCFCAGPVRTRRATSTRKGSTRSSRARSPCSRSARCSSATASRHRAPWSRQASCSCRPATPN
jgi:hypothetical protein